MKNRKGLSLFYFFFFFLASVQLIMAQMTNFWIPTNGPEAGNIWSIVFKTPYIFVSTWGKGVLRSADDGESWTEVNNGLMQNPIVTMAQLEVNDRGQLFGAHWRGIARSDDYGDSWILFDPLNSGFGVQYPDLAGLAVDSKNVLYTVARGIGVFRSDDAGVSWVRCYACEDNQMVTAIEVIPNTGSIFVAVLDQNKDPRELTIIRSEDGGTSWIPCFRRESTYGDNSIIMRTNGFAVDPFRRIIYAGIFREGIWKSVDDGLSWDPIEPNNLQPDIWSIAVEPITGNLYAGSEGVWRKENGASWVRLFPLSIGPDFPYSWPGVGCIGFNPSTPSIFIGFLTGPGLFRSRDNAISWIQVNKGIRNSMVMALAVDMNDQIFAGTFYSDVFRTNDYGATWTHLYAGLPGPGVSEILIHHSSGKVFVAPWAGGLYQSVNNGETWAHILTFPNDGCTALIADPNSGYIYAGTAQSGVVRSTDNGSTWQPFSLNGQNPTVDCLSIDSAGSVYAGTSTMGVFRSDDQGNTWISASNGLPSGYEIRVLAVSPKGYIFAGTVGAGVYRSADKGRNWIQLPPSSVYPWSPDCLAINLEGHIFSGYYRSTDDGATWDLIVDWGIIPNSIRALAFDHRGYLYAGDHGGGVYRSAESTLSDPVVLINSLISLVKSMNIKQGISNSLDAKLENAVNALTSVKEGDRQDAVNKLQAFINECEAQSGNALTEAQAQQLITRAAIIITILQSG